LLAAAGAGLVLALFGGRLSRSLLTLAGVAAGTFVGLHAPAWLGLKIDGIGAAFCGAIAIGACGFLMHRFWIGILFASLLSSAAGGATWLLQTGGAGAWHVPQLDLQQPLATVLAQVWTSLPAGLYPALPIALAVGSGLGMMLSVLWPKFTRLMFYSLFGTILMILTAALAAEQLAPQWLTRVPGNPWIELAIFAGVVLVAFGLQWLLTPRAPRSKQTASEKLAAFDADDDDPRPLIAQSFSPPHFKIDQKRQETATRRTRAIAA
jgi:hypothetical protein